MEAGQRQEKERDKDMI